MKKTLALILALLMLAALMGCAQQTPAPTQAPATQAPATQAPATQAPATQAPATQAPATAQPTPEPTSEPTPEPVPDHYPVTISTYNYAKEPIEVTFEKCPEKVVCTNQTQTELMLYFGLDEYIAGTAYLDGTIREDLQAQYDALKAAGKELTVKGYPSKEIVLALEPDFIFGWRSAFAENQLGDVSEWHDMGVGTMILRCSNNTAPTRDLETCLQDIADIGKIFNIEDKTDVYINEAHALMDRIAQKAASVEKPYTAIIIEPFGGTFYCWGSNTLTGALVVAAGAEYALPDGGDLSLEDIINLNPDVIIVDYMDDENLTPEESKANAIATIMNEPALAEVTAVANGKVMAINLTDVYGGGIRMVPSVETMFDFMYGDDYAPVHYPVTISTYNYAKEPVEVTFEKCPEKVICTNQTQTELMLYFGLDEYIAGTAYLDGTIREDLQAQYDALKAAGKELTVKGYPSKEVVLSLEPDFIFGWRSAFAEDQLGDVSEWHDMGVGTMILRCSNNTAPTRDLETCLQDIADIGKIFNIEEKTGAYIYKAHALMDKIAKKVESVETPYTAIIIEPFGGTFYCWGANTLTGALVVAAGAEYALPDGGDLSLEDIINLNPDVIIVDYMDDENLTPEESQANAIASIMDEAALAEVSAVANGRVMAINLTDVYGGGIRMVPSVETMFNFMYGD